MTRRFVGPLLAFLVLVAFLYVGLFRDPREVPSPLVDKPAPAFAAPLLAAPERTLRPQDLLGKVWLLNVWASWCAACREEHPVLVDFARRRATPIYGLNYKDLREDGLRWLAAFGDPYVASVHDPKGRIGLDYGVYGVPETFVIDRQGIVRMKHIGPITPQVLDRKILPLLEKLERG